MSSWASEPTVVGCQQYGSTREASLQGKGESSCQEGYPVPWVCSRMGLLQQSHRPGALVHARMSRVHTRLPRSMGTSL